MDDLPSIPLAESFDWACFAESPSGKIILRELNAHFDTTSPIYKPHVILRDPAAADLLGKIKAGHLEVMSYINHRANYSPTPPKPQTTEDHGNEDS